MEDLIDIQGLDAINWWPLALAWWVVIALGIAILLGGGYLLLRRVKYRRSWQYKAYRTLTKMHAEIGNCDLKQILQRLSVELRKIAMQTTTRNACASLAGQQWLQWLEAHDPDGYAWTMHGKLLINAQYMPGTSNRDDSAQVADLILAAQGWVKKC